MERKNLQLIVIEIFDEIDKTQIPEVIRLYDEAFCNCPPYWETDAEASVLAELKKIKNDPCLKFLVVREGDEFAGLLITTSADKDLYILELMVDKRYRHQGIGFSLIEKATEIAKVGAKDGIRLRTNLQNEGAVNLYKKLGFRFFGQADIKNQSEVFLRKKLKE